jgi:hypothetical protein
MIDRRTVVVNSVFGARGVRGARRASKMSIRSVRAARAVDVSCARTGRPIVSQSAATTGNAIASGIERERPRTTALGAGSRFGRSMYDFSMVSARGSQVPLY